MALLGNSGSPRWYQGGPERLDQYLANLHLWGATSTEMVLHHGPADERTARVHVLEPDWEPMIARYREIGVAIQLHASLDSRFATERWLDEPDSLREEFLPILAVARALTTEQGRVVLVVHGAADDRRSRQDNQTATVGLLTWLGNEVEKMPGQALIALELGATKLDCPNRVARTRESVLDLVQAVGSPKLGICWDLAHDLENAAHDEGWATVPSPDFLKHVVHIHLHDLDAEGVSHYPLVTGRVPFPEQLQALARLGSLPSITMEIRWRCAERLGDPWDLLGQSYHVAAAALAEIEAARPIDGS